eukprot:3933806-Rhodomonas_salina.3
MYYNERPGAQHPPAMTARRSQTQRWTPTPRPSPTATALETRKVCLEKDMAGRLRRPAASERACAEQPGAGVAAGDRPLCVPGDNHLCDPADPNADAPRRAPAVASVVRHHRPGQPRRYRHRHPRAAQRVPARSCVALSRVRSVSSPPMNKQAASRLGFATSGLRRACDATSGLTWAMPRPGNLLQDV